MNDPKTTITAIIGTLLFLLTHVLSSIGISIEVPPEVRSAIVVVTVFLIGIFARDGRSGDE